jgi:hypothetical protein
MLQFGGFGVVSNLRISKLEYWAWGDCTEASLQFFFTPLTKSCDRTLTPTMNI